MASEIPLEEYEDAEDAEVWITTPPAARVCATGRGTNRRTWEPSNVGPKQNWYEAIPEFWLPNSKPYDAARWPDYSTEFVAARMEAIDDYPALLVFHEYGKLQPKQWGAWFGGFACDKPTGWIEPFLGPVADRIYDMARYKYLVPAWRRALTKVITQIDDLEDQVSTILWIAEWLTKKYIPMQPGALNLADQVRHSLDCGEKMLAGITPFRGFKSEYANCRRSTTIATSTYRTRKAQLLDWFKQNHGRLLEAAQATGTWFDVGIILGPVMGFIEEGQWGMAKAVLDNYLVAADALWPGSRADFERNAEELSNKIDAAWDETWGSIESWDTDTIIDQFPGFAAP